MPEKLGVDAETAAARLDRARARLFEARAPRVRPGLDDKILTSWNAMMVSGLTVAGEALGKPAFSTAGFVMTLQRTDIGVGQTPTGTSRRSSEVFVPLAARDTDPDFWGWPGGFTSDPRRPGKFDRRGVRIRLDREVVSMKRNAGVCAPGEPCGRYADRLTRARSGWLSCTTCPASPRESGSIRERNPREPVSSHDNLSWILQCAV